MTDLSDRVEFLEQAVRDLEGIESWSAGHFGEVVARRYVRGLIEAALAIPDRPYAWRAVPGATDRMYVLHRIRTARNGHVIVFRKSASAFVVIRILHTAMDLSSFGDESSEQT